MDQSEFKLPDPIFSFSQQDAQVHNIIPIIFIIYKYTNLKAWKTFLTIQSCFLLLVSAERGNNPLGIYYIYFLFILFYYGKCTSL